MLPAALVFGFGSTLAGWVIAYALRLPGDAVPPMVLGLLLIAVQLAGAALAGRTAAGIRPWVAGSATGVVSSALNLLVVLSAFSGDDPDAARLDAAGALAAAGSIAVGAVVGAAAGLVGGRLAARDARDGAHVANWLSRFAALNTAGAWLLLVAGGIVTSARAGLAVPDWPESFGANMFLFPLSKMTGGVFIEHAHRLLAVLVALNTAALLVWSLIAKAPALARAVVAAASALVIAQAVLGGLRVTQTSDALGMVHGVIGQVYVAALALAAAVLSSAWRSGPAPRPHPAARAQRTLNALALAALLVQIAFGAAVRHFDAQPHALWSHVGFSVVALILLLAAGVRAQHTVASAHRWLRISATATKHAAIVQMALGVIALVAVIVWRDEDTPPAVSVALRSPHQAVGAALLIAATLLTAWTRRLTTPPT
ncbi:MAG: hypothetical protein D6693_01360 [Planctomycetota bacterium]|nr:MAG: hypothetical protein D6693_01360 [Planctomycetota bacterium]